MENPRYRVILRAMFAAVMQSELGASDLRFLAAELRGGRLPGELAYMLDRANEHFQDPSNSREISDKMRAAERLMREKRVSKSALLNILRSINAVAVPNEGTTTRSILHEFFASATPREAEKLLDVLSAAGDADPYLKGIVETRR
jgi:hypothetical protein